MIKFQLTEVEENIFNKWNKKHIKKCKQDLPLLKGKADNKVISEIIRNKLV